MSTLVGQLQRWQRREWLYRAIGGLGRLTVVIATGLTLACLTDWIIDRTRDTPYWFRVIMTLAQVVVYGLTAYFVLLKLHVPTLDRLAGRAEEEIPEFGHRLVTALQLNRPQARTEGMSRELIKQVTAEAESLSARHDLARLAKPTRLKQGVLMIAPVILFVGLFLAWKPGLTTALLARQLLLNVDIPRAITIENATAELWPSGDEVDLRVKVTGPLTQNATGYALVSPEGEPSERFPLTLQKQVADNEAIYGVKLPPSTQPFTYRAWVGDGRMRRSASVRFEPRPVVKEIEAWVLLPRFVDPTGKNRYERYQPQGEVLAYPESSVRVKASISKPVKSATVVILTRDRTAQETEFRREPMTLDATGENAEVVFDLPPRPSGYRIEVTDEHGFGNSNPPRRGITLAPDEPPRVNLLSEVLKDPKSDGPLDDYEVNGMPLILGGQVQIGYAARSPLGVDRAQIVYRVNDGPWVRLPLTPVRIDPEKSNVGRFLPELGVFEESGEFGQVEFYSRPAADPTAEPSGLEAGGRFNFQTAALTRQGENGNMGKLEIGDRVEFYVEAFDRNPAPNRLPGRSESRIKTVVTQAQLQAWLEQRDQSRERLRQLEERQRGVFTRPKS